MSKSRRCCLCCCILLIILIVVGVIVVFILHKKLGPSLEANYKVTDASLTDFGMGSGNSLDYNLVTNISIENPNKYSDYKYEKFEASASYADQDLAEVTLKPFEVEKKNTSALTPIVFKGQKSVSLKGDDVSNIKSGTAFDIVLKLKVKVVSRAGKVDIYNEYKVECNLKVPLIKAKSPEKFQSTDCKQVGSSNSGIKV